jgi:subtilisin family serine protease
MRTTRLSTIYLTGAAFTAALAMSGCAPLTQGLAARASSTGGDAGSIFSLASARSASMAMRSVATVSLALDRIDQRALPLDATYSHRGTGRGVTVYVFDGGVSTVHPELAGRVRLGYTAFPNDPKICNAHGTAVAGAIAGSTLGVAPEAEIVDVKMVECRTLRGTIRGIVEGARWVIEDHAVRGGPAIANWSFIADTATQIPALDSAVAQLRRAGIAVVVSAGNLDMNACRISPGNADGSIVVGASAIVTDTVEGKARHSDARAPRTAWGPCIDIYAPGDSVLLPSVDGELRPMSQVWSGTSMSAGYVSGAAALFLQAAPAATPDQVAEFLKRNATHVPVQGARSPLTRVLYVGTSRGSAEQPRTVSELLSNWERTSRR